MLVLSRQRDETIMIGDEIEITVVDIRGDKVRLGITAPTRIAVHRKEVYQAIRAENEQAAKIIGQELPRISPTAATPPTPGNIAPGPARTRSRVSELATGAPKSTNTGLPPGSPPRLTPTSSPSPIETAPQASTPAAAAQPNKAVKRA